MLTIIFNVIAYTMFMLVIKGAELFGYVMFICNVISLVKRTIRDYEEEWSELELEEA